MTSGLTKRLRERLGPNRHRSNLTPFSLRLQAVARAEAHLAAMTDAALRREATSLRTRAEGGEPVDVVTVAGFAQVREVARRVLGQRPFDVQILGGLALFDGFVVEMKTGEGKTLAAVAPAVVHALLKRSVHILTFNDYLARRDAEWMGDIYRYFGLRVAFVQEGMSSSERRAAYGADITYATAKEAGFDFLRDGLVLDPAEIVHRRLDVAIVDEADSILIDEARIPLVIAGSVETEQRTPERLAQLVARLDAGHHYEGDREHSTAHLTDDGLDLAENLLGEIVLHDEANLPLLNDLHAALYAAVILEKDVDYIVRDGRVEVVDEFTGRVAEDRHWPDRLQAAIEAKEGVRSSAEGRILGQITLHHFLSQYQHRCGMTATAAVSAREFIQVYGLEVKVVPPNRPCLRVDQADAVFADAETWNAALIEEIRSVHARSRPLLVGTPSVAESESLAARLRQAGIACAVLNAKCDAEEADLIAEAGRPGAVTVSTNMAGRGTDICLGGSDASTRDAVVALGGLYVICTHHHESRRVDDQLRGRAGRQGDPGSSRFFVSLEDELMDTYGIGELIPQRHWPAPTFAPITDPFVLREVARVQRIAEGSSYDLRHALLQYSQIVEEQRRIAFEHRRQVLAGARPPDGSRDSPSWQPRFQRLVHRLGAETTADLTHRLYLLAIDDVWSDHLALVAEIREGIHLVGVGGMSPLEEFAKEVIAAFAHFHERVDELFSERLSALAENHDLTIDDRSLRGPSSTWTYLIDDSLFENRVASAIIGNRDIGFSAGAALTGPLLALWALARKRRRRR